MTTPKTIKICTRTLLLVTTSGRPVRYVIGPWT